MTVRCIGEINIPYKVNGTNSHWEIMCDWIDDIGVPLAYGYFAHQLKEY